MSLNSFLIPMMIMIVVCIGVFLSCLICYCMMKPWKDYNQKHIDLERPEEVNINNSIINHNYNGKFEQSFNNEKLNNLQRNTSNDQSIISNSKLQARKNTNNIESVASFRIEIKPANRDNYIADNKINTGYWM